MANWEYLAIQVGWPNTEGGGYVKWVNGQEDKRFGKNKTQIYNALKVLGSEGWDLVAIDNRSTHVNSDPVYYFKRPA